MSTFFLSKFSKRATARITSVLYFRVENLKGDIAMEEKNEFTQEQANKELINTVRDLQQEMKMIRESNYNMYLENKEILQELKAIKDNTGFYIIIFAVKIIIYILLILLAGKGAYDLLQFLF